MNCVGRACAGRNSFPWQIVKELGEIIGHFTICFSLQDEAYDVYCREGPLMVATRVPQALRTCESPPPLGPEAGFSCQRAEVLHFKAL